MIQRGKQIVSSRQVSVNGHGIDLAELEKSLCELPAVQECVVRPRQDANGVTELVAYVVPDLPYVPEPLVADIKSRMPSDLVRCLCVPVVRMPLTETGEIDEKVLIELPVIDEGLLQRWEQRLHGIVGLNQAAIVIREQTPDHVPLHLSDLMPAWKPTGAKACEEASEAANDPRALLQDFQPRASAFADGGPLVIPGDAPKTLTEALLRIAREFPNKGIIVDSRARRFSKVIPCCCTKPRQEPLVQSTSLHALLYKPNETRIDLDRRCDLKFGFRLGSPE